MSSDVCTGIEPCNTCIDDCAGDPDYEYRDWLYDMDADPRESTNLIHRHPEVGMGSRALVDVPLSMEGGKGVSW